MNVIKIMGRKVSIFLLVILIMLGCFGVHVQAQEDDQPQDETYLETVDLNETEEAEEEFVFEQEIVEAKEDALEIEETVEVEEDISEEEVLEIEETQSEETDEITEIDTDDEEELFEFDLSAYIIQEGGFPSEEDEIYSPDGTASPVVISSSLSAAEKAIYNGLIKRKASIDVSAYNLTAEKLFTSYYKVLNENPQLFYVSFHVRGYISGSYVTRVVPEYYSTSQSDIDLFESKVDMIISAIDEDWAPLSKLIYLHDWLISHCDYDFELNGHNAFNAIVEGSAVCQGYALAFCLLAKKAGFDCHVVTSDMLNHAWNIVVLDDDYYYLDVTFDDGGDDNCFYIHFLCSRDEMYENNHDTDDWNCNGINVYQKVPTSDRFKDHFLHELYSRPLCVYENKAVYFDFDKGIVIHDLETDKEVTCLEPLTNKYNYVSYFSAVPDIDGSVYFNSNTDIFRLDMKDLSIEPYYSLSEEEAALGNIYCLSMKDLRVQYKLIDRNYNEYVLIDTVKEELAVKQNAKTGELIIAGDEGFTEQLNNNAGIDIVLNDERFSFFAYDNGDLLKKDQFYEITNTIDGDIYVSIPLAVLKNHNVPGGEGRVEVYNGEKILTKDIDLSASAKAPEISVFVEDDALKIACPDPDFLSALLTPEVYDYTERSYRKGSQIIISSDGKEKVISNKEVITNNYDVCSEDIRYENGVINIDKEALKENGVLNGEEVNVYVLVYGYEKTAAALQGGLQIACEQGTVDFLIYQEDGDLIIESADEDWLQALASPEIFNGEDEIVSFKDHGYIEGIVNDFVYNNNNVDIEVSLVNRRYDNRTVTSYSYENGRIVIPESSLIENKFPGGTYDLTLHAPGYEDNSVQDLSIESPIRAYLPSDLKTSFSLADGILLKSSDSQRLEALARGKVEIYGRKGDSYVFDDPIRFSIQEGSFGISLGHLAAMGITTASYDILFEPEGYINYGVRCYIRIAESTKKIFVASFYDHDDSLLAKILVEEGKTLKAIAEPSRRGYSFAGWYLNDQKYSFGSAVAADLSLKAQYSENTYKLVYNANGGKGTIEKAQTYKLNDPVIVSSLSPYKNGYAFLGWSTNKNDLEPLYHEGDDITGINIDLKNNATIMFYAIYSDPISYSLTLDPRGGVLKAKQVYDERLTETDGLYLGSYDILSKAFKLPVLVKDYYSFGGWRDLETDKKVSSIAKGSYGDRCLYAYFTPVSYKLSYNLNKGSIAKDEVYDKTFNIESESIVLPRPVRKGYLFKGWYSDKALSQEVMSIDDLTMKNTSLYAKWEPITYTITYRADGFDDVIVDGFVYDRSYKLDKDVFNTPGKAVKKFSYSYLDAKGKMVAKTVAATSSIKNLVSEDKGNIVLSVTKVIDKKSGAVSELWSYVSYSISYALEKGISNPSKNPKKYSYSEEENLYRINNPIKLGYDLLYWTYEDRQGEVSYIYPVDNDGTKDGYAYLPAGIYQDLVLTPYFEDEPATYSISYTGELGSFEQDNPNPISYSYSKSTALVLSSPVRTGYSFTGWYLNGKKVTSIAKGSHGNLVLEARWKANTYKLRFNANGGSGSMSDLSLTYDSDKVLTVNKFKRKHYSFIGWNTIPDGSGIMYSDCQSVRNLAESGTVTFYAIWQEDPKFSFEIEIIPMCDDYNKVGNEWSFYYKYNNEPIGDGSRIIDYANETGKLYIKITEVDGIPESAAKTINVSLYDGFTTSTTLKVTENGGRYKGRSAIWNVYVKVNVVE